MDLKSFLVGQGAKLLKDPRFVKLLQDERVMKALMQAMQMRGRLQETIDQRVERMARSLNLATRAEVRGLERALRKVERDLEKARSASVHE